MLVLQGRQGTTKSTIARRLRSLIDPTTPMARRMPKGEEDLMIAAQNSHVLNFDNLSKLEPAQSDALSAIASVAAAAANWM